MITQSLYYFAKNNCKGNMKVKLVYIRNSVNAPGRILKMFDRANQLQSWVENEGSEYKWCQVIGQYVEGSFGELVVVMKLEEGIDNNFSQIRLYDLLRTLQGTERVEVYTKPCQSAGVVVCAQVNECTKVIPLTPVHSLLERMRYNVGMYGNFIVKHVRNAIPSEETRHLENVPTILQIYLAQPNIVIVGQIKTIDEYPEMTIGTFIRSLSGKDEVVIIEQEGTDDKELYNDRVEYLQWTKDGCAHPLCSRKIATIESPEVDRYNIFVEVEK